MASDGSPAFDGDDEESSGTSELAFATLASAAAAPGRAPLVWPMDPGPRAPDILAASVAGFWRDFAVTLPVVHRATLEAALASLGPPSPGGPAPAAVAPARLLYQKGPPLALLFAAAAMGSVFVDVPGIAFADRLVAGHAYAERAKAMLLAGFYDRAPPDRTMGAVEALQVLLVLNTLLTFLGLAHETFHITRHISDLAEEVCGGISRRDMRPASPAEWVLLETRARMLVCARMTDVFYALHASRAPAKAWFAEPVPVPGAEHFWDHPDPDEAYAAMYGGRPEAAKGPFLFDFRRLLPPEDPDDPPASLARTLAVRELIEPTFSKRATFGTFGMLQNFIHYVSAYTNLSLAQHNIRPLALVSQDPALDTPAEAAYRRSVVHASHLLSDAASALPPELAGLVTGTNAARFFSVWPRYFPSRGVAHSFFGAMCMQQSLLGIDGFLSGDPGAADPGMFAAPTFLRALEGALTIVRLLEAQMADDPELRWVHPMWLSGPALRAGHVMLGAERVAGSSGGEAEVVARALDAYAGRFGPVMGKVAAGFRRAAGEARAARVRGGEAALGFARVAVEPEKAFAPYIK